MIGEFIHNLPNSYNKYTIMLKIKRDLFRLRGCEKITEKYILLVHFYTFFLNIYFIFFGEIKNNVVMSIYHRVIILKLKKSSLMKLLTF